MFLAILIIIAVVSAISIWFTGENNDTTSPIYNDTSTINSLTSSNDVFDSEDESFNTNSNFHDSNMGIIETEYNDYNSHEFKNQINPATGLPMISGDTSGVDVAGNPYGFNDELINNNHLFDSFHDHAFHDSSISSWHDDSSWSSSSFDSSFNSWD